MPTASPGAGRNAEKEGSERGPEVGKEIGADQARAEMVGASSNLAALVKPDSCPITPSLPLTMFSAIQLAA